MIFTEKELEDILKQGENSSVEFKSASVRPESLAREIVAFANSNGGVILLENLRYIDRLGRGLPMVWREMHKLGGRVEFKEIGEEFKVTLLWE